MKVGSDNPIDSVLSNETTAVRIRKVDTGNGVRLEINSPRLEKSIRLDPIALESLTWQTRETFSDLLNGPERPPDSPPHGELGQHAVSQPDMPERSVRMPMEEDPDTPFEMTLSNEFAMVQIRRVDARDGTRLEISSPRLHHGIQLDPTALETLTWQTPETFSRFLEEPFGPSEHEV